jgi:hypothetical protein
MAVDPTTAPTANFLCRSLSSTKRKEDNPMVASLSSSDTKSAILYCVATKSVITYISFVPSFVYDCLFGCRFCLLNGLI